jgi:hypothetical protein
MKTKKSESYEKREAGSVWAKKLTPLLQTGAIQDDRLEVWHLAHVAFLGFAYLISSDEYGEQSRWVAVELWNNLSIQDFESVGEVEAGQFVEYCESKFQELAAEIVTVS